MPMNSQENKQPNIPETNIRVWSEESIIVGALAKKFGKNGVLEFDLNIEDFPKSVNFSIKDNKVFIYAE